MPDASDLDYPFSLELIEANRPTRNQTTGEYENPDDEDAVEITGNFSPSPLTSEFWQEDSGDHYKEGEARLFTNDDVSIGDKVRVHQDDSGSNYIEYRVDEIIDNYGLLTAAADPDLGNIHVAGADEEDGRTEYRLERLDS